MGCFSSKLSSDPPPPSPMNLKQSRLLRKVPIRSMNTPKVSIEYIHCIPTPMHTLIIMLFSFYSCSSFSGACRGICSSDSMHTILQVITECYGQVHTGGHCTHMHAYSVATSSSWSVIIAGTAYTWRSYHQYRKWAMFGDCTIISMAYIYITNNE